jgi:hypothetical protein
MKNKMNWMFLISCFFISLFLIGCGSKNYEIPPNEKAVNDVVGRNSKALAKKYCMRPFAITVAMPGGDIKYLELEFQIRGPLSQQELRKVLINSAHDFLNDINADLQLCSYLKNNHMEIKDIGITLFLIGSTGIGLKAPYISIASISKGKLEYEIMALKYDTVIKREIPYIKSVSTETYEEAINALKTQNKVLDSSGLISTLRKILPICVIQRTVIHAVSPL